jgi:hypothetical protein
MRIRQKGNSRRAALGEANVLLDLRLHKRAPEDVLAANAEQVLEAFIDSAPDVALGPALSIAPVEQAIELCFDVEAETPIDAQERSAALLPSSAAS